MFQLQSYKSLVHFKNVPPIINPSNIHIITDTNYLLDLENKYDNFLEKNVDLLDLYNIIDELIDIRNTITLQISRIRRKKQMYNYYYNNENNDENNNLTKSNYTLTKNSVKEYKCGCKNITYQNIQYQKQKNLKSNQIPIIQKQKHCNKHLNMLKTKCILEEELTKINTELANITNKENEV